MRAKASYPIFEVLDRDTDFVTARAVREANGKPILVKVPAATPPAPALVHQLEHEARLAPDLDPDWALRPRSLDWSSGSPVLELDDFQGGPFAAAGGLPMAMGRFLPLALGIATAVGKMHGRSFIHCNLNPNTVWVNEATREARLTGFGIARHVPPGYPALAPTDEMEGAPAYFAPEQTGRLSRSIDHRTDLYSLGVILYELSTGILPCVGEDLMGGVHCHIARQPKPPAALVPGLPAGVSDLVMKLLAKDPDDRYQTASGLQADLARCWQLWQASHAVASFPLGQRDVSDRLLVPHRLYGREREQAVLAAAYERVASQGRSEWLLVAGYSGVGKTALVKELEAPIVGDDGLYAVGKCDQSQRGVPYVAFAQAVQELARSLLRLDEARLESWKQALERALGSNGRLITDLSPAFELLLGPQPPVPALPASEARHRFHQACQQVLGVFARPEHPLVLFLDDLQWADGASLDLLRYLAAQPELGALLVIGAYRDNEVGPAHPLQLLLDEVERTRTPIRRLVLPPLPSGALRQFLGDAVHASIEAVAPLGALIEEKAQGNPFFTIQFLSELHREGLLRFDPEAIAWRWDLAGIGAMNYTDNVLVFMAHKVQRLPARTRELLGLIACVGSRIDDRSLATIADQPGMAVDDALESAIREGLLARTRDGYRFLHDRIQQAAYALVPEEARPETHLEIGRRLLAQTPPEALEARIFLLVGQLNLGAARIGARAERQRVAELDLLAGRRAKAGSAYEAAFTYFSAGLPLLAEDAWSSQYDVVYPLQLERAEAQWLTGRFGEAERTLAEILDHARTAIDKAAAYRVSIELHMTLGATEAAAEVGLASLRLFGVDLPLHPGWQQVLDETTAIEAGLRERPAETLVDLPPMTEPAMHQAIATLAALYTPAYWVDANLMCLVSARMVTISMRHGNNAASALGYAGYGRMLGPMLGQYELGYRIGKVGLDLVERHDLRGDKARILDLFGISTAFWVRPLREGLEYARQALRAANEVGDLTFACYANMHIIKYMLAKGEPLEAIIIESARSLAYVRAAGYEEVADIILSLRHLAQGLRGDLDPADAEALAERMSSKRTAFTRGWYYTDRCQAAYLAGDGEGAADAAVKARPLLEGFKTQLSYPIYVFYAALALAQRWPAVGPQDRAEHREWLDEYAQRLGTWARTSPTTFAGQHHLVAAEIARIDDRPWEAAELFEQAILATEADAQIQIKALAQERAGRFFLARGLRELGHAYLREARSTYARWGADAVVERLAEMDPRLVPPPAGPTPGGHVPAASIDTAAAMLASQTIAHEVRLDRLIETIMRVVVESSGANRGKLLMLDDGGFVTEAAAHVEEGATRIATGPFPDQAAEWPASILHYARRTRMPVVLQDAGQSELFRADPYVVATQPRSVACVPLLRLGELLGLLYLENDLVAGAFTPGRVSLLELLASQAAVSLENARLYGELEARVDLRTRELRATSDALRRSEEMFRMLVEAAPDAIVIVDIHGAIVLVNSQTEKLFGFTRAELLGQDAALLRPAPWTAGLDQELRARRKDGSEFPVEVAQSPIETSQGPWIISTVRDLTERKRALEEIAIRTAELRKAEELSRLKDYFLSTLSHEIKTPISLIAGYAELLEDKYPDEEFLAGIQDGTRRLTEHVNRILDYSALMSGSLPYYGVEIGLPEVIGELSFEFGPRLEEAGLQFVVEQAPDLPLIEADPRRLLQMAGELLDNARKVTPPGGTISLRADRMGDDVRLSVCDTGPGLSKEELAHAWEAFQQVEQSDATRRGGIGLGLAIVKGLADLQGGRVEVDTEPGRGSCFSIVFPSLA